ncbi:MAG TPA: cohesin domain-containing protein [Terracidiphilus sp.]|nr:cohesin domain-containing protein [Terracidiphilus sp.]
MAIAIYRICGECDHRDLKGASMETGSTMGRANAERCCAGLRPVSGVILLLTVFAVLVMAGMGGIPAQAESAKSIFKKGQAAEARQDYDTAYNDYQKALSMAPNEMSYQTALYRVRISASALHVGKGRKLLQAGNQQGALMEFLHAVEIDPSNEAAEQEIAKIRAMQPEQAPPSMTGVAETPAEQKEIESMGAPVELKPLSNEPLTLYMVNDSKTVYQAIGQAAGINVLFDPDYTGKRIQVDLKNVSLLDALRIVGTLSNTFWRPITSNSIFVAANSRTKRAELEEEAVQTFYLTNAWQQNDLNDVQTAIRNLLPNTHVYGVQSQNAIVMRATPDELLLAQKIINDLDKARPEVVVDIAVLEVNKNWERTLGIAWPNSAGVQLQSPTASSSTCPTGSTNCTPTTGTSPTLYNLAHLNSNDFAVTIGAATANLLLSDSNTKVLQNPRIRATDQQKATMKIGQRVPIATGSYQTGAATALVSSLVNTQFQYQDVGVNIEMTPTIHYDDEVTLKMKIDVSSIASYSTISGVTEPIFAQHQTEQVIRLREGEASILGGILEKQDQVTWTGIPGLSSIPLVKYLFGSKDHTITEDEIVFLVTPHIMRAQDLTPLNLRPVDTGTGQTIELRYVPASTTNGNRSSAAQPTNSITTEPTAGTVQGESAAGAAPAAMAQLNAAAQGNANQVAPSAQASPPTPPAPGALSFSLVPPPGPVNAGATIQVPIVITGATDIASVPLQVQYDPSKLSLVNVGDGDFLNRGNQPVALVHRDDGPGNIVLNASRPPGAPGVSGAGVVCVLTFQAKSSGESAITIAHPLAMTSAQQSLQAPGARTSITVK